MSRAAVLKIERARWWAISEQPFYGALAMRLIDVIDKRCQTAMTDGKVIRWNPEFVESLTDLQVRGVLLHETMHCAHQHMWRLPCDDAGNEAGDFVINLTLTKIPGCELPAGALLDAQYEGMAEEDVLLARRKPPTPPQQQQQQDDSDEQEQQGDEEGEGSGGGGSDDASDDKGDGASDDSSDDESAAGDDEGDADDDAQSDGDGDAPDGDEEGEGSGSSSGKPDSCGGFSKPAADAPTAAEQAEQSKQLADQWERAVMQAAQTAQALGQGALPADLQRELDRMRVQRIDWRRELADFVRDMLSARNDWSRPARRHAWQSVIFPKRRNDDIGTILAVRDTSGSITAQLCAQFTGLIEQAAEETNARVVLIDCDAAIQSERVIEPGQEFPLNAYGGGGTDFRPVFERANELVEQGERIAGILYLTDLYGTEPEQNDHPTLWLCTTPNKSAATGRTVYIDPSYITN